jgi:hypothetical protein
MRACSTALYVYWDSHDQFREKLYPIAEAAHRSFGAKAVIVTVCWRTFPVDLLENRWLKLHNIEEPTVEGGLFANGKGLLRQIFGYLSRHINEKKCWRKQAIDLIDQYNPQAIFLSAPYSREVPWLVNIANQRNVKTLFIGPYNCTFGYDSLITQHRRNATLSIMEATQNLAWYNKAIVFIGSYIDPWLESLVYMLLGIRGWKRYPSILTAVTYHLVPNELFRSELLRLGADYKRVIATGVAEQDELFKLRQQSAKLRDSERARGIVALGSEEKLVVFVLENFPAMRSVISVSEVNEMILLVINECIRFENARVIIKVHPRDSIDKYLWISDEYPGVQILHHYETVKLAAMADVILVHASTAVSMAIAVNRPSLIIDFNNLQACDIVRQGYGVEKIGTPAILHTRLAEIFSGNFIYDSRESRIAMSIIDGKAVQRILALSGLAQAPISESDSCL